jgi:hypothetical protein
MFLKIVPLVVRNLLRSKTRLATTLTGCAVGAFVMSFFLAAGNSLDNAMRDTRVNSNLIITQQDRF